MNLGGSLREDTRQLVIGVVATLIGTVTIAILGTVFDVLARPLVLPVWGYLSILTLVLIFAWAAVFLARQQQRATFRIYEGRLADAEAERQQLMERLDETVSNSLARERDLQERITELEEEIRVRDEMKLVHGLYYRASDSKLEQPFCRMCWESDERKAHTVVTIYRNVDGLWQYYCDWCKRSYGLPGSFGENRQGCEHEEDPF